MNVYEIIKRQLVHKKSLYGHSDGITCLAASSAYGLLVSGSRDRSAIIWDLARKAFVRQLIPHEAPVAALAINEQTVSLWQLSCMGANVIYVLVGSYWYCISILICLGYLLVWKYFVLLF